MMKFYTSNCNNCKTLEKFMNDNNIIFEKIDDEETDMAMSDFTGIREMPFANVNGSFYHGEELKNIIKSMVR